MVAEMLEKMMALADQYKGERKEAERRAVQACIEYVHAAWRQSELTKQYCTDKPKDDLERVVFGIPGIKVYKDATQTLYELDGCRFESSLDVIQYLIDTRDREKARARLWARREAAELMSKRVLDMDTALLLEQKPHKSINATIHIR